MSFEEISLGMAQFIFFIFMELIHVHWVAYDGFHSGQQEFDKW